MKSDGQRRRRRGGRRHHGRRRCWSGWASRRRASRSRSTGRCCPARSGTRQLPDGRAGGSGDGGAGWLSPGSSKLTIAGRDVRLAADPGHRRRAEPRRAGGGAGRLGHRADHRGDAPGRRRGRHRRARPAEPAGHHPAAQHRGLPRRGRGGADRAAGPRGAGHRLGQARGHRRRAHPAARRDRIGPRRRATGRRRLRRAALHQRRPGAGPPARGHRLRGGDAAGLADRHRAGHRQPAQHRDDRRPPPECR